MTIPYINLIRTVWQNGKPWHRSILGYYCAYILAQGFLSLSPYAFGRTIDLLQHFSQDKFHQILFWLIFGVMLLFRTAACYYNTYSARTRDF